MRTSKRQVYRALGVDIHRAKVTRGVSRITASAVPTATLPTVGRLVEVMIDHAPWQCWRQGHGWVCCHVREIKRRFNQ
jgi:hypothetical protein